MLQRCASPSLAGPPEGPGHPHATQQALSTPSRLHPNTSQDHPLRGTQEGPGLLLPLLTAPPGHLAALVASTHLPRRRWLEGLLVANPSSHHQKSSHTSHPPSLSPLPSLDFSVVYGCPAAPDPSPTSLTGKSQRQAQVILYPAAHRDEQTVGPQ